MKCPFRVNISWGYKPISDNGYLQTRQEETYPECYGNDCPFYDGYSGCTRINYESDD